MNASPATPSPDRATLRAMARKTTTKTAERKPRNLSILSRTGDEAKAAAERALLLKTLKANDWNLTHTAKALEMGDASSVLRAVEALGLRDEYEKHRA